MPRWQTAESLPDGPSTCALIRRGGADDFCCGAVAVVELMPPFYFFLSTQAAPAEEKFGHCPQASDKADNRDCPG